MVVKGQDLRKMKRERKREREKEALALPNLSVFPLLAYYRYSGKYTYTIDYLPI